MNKNIESVILPVYKSGRYKVVQFVKENGQEKSLYLRFASMPIEGVHADILKAFANEVREKTTSKETSVGTVYYFLENSKYKIVGAGKCDIDLEEKIAIFHDGSFGYNMNINKDHVEESRNHLPGWELVYDKNDLSVSDAMRIKSGIIIKRNKGSDQEDTFLVYK